MLFNIVCANIIILLCFFFFFLIIDLYFLVAAVISQLFNPNAELAIPIGILTKEAKVAIETHTVIAEGQVRKCSVEFKIV